MKPQDNSFDILCQQIKALHDQLKALHELQRQLIAEHERLIRLLKR